MSADLKDAMQALEGEAASFARAHARELAELPARERLLWTEIAAHLSGQRLRDKRSLLMVLVEAFAIVGRRPELEETANSALLHLTSRSARLTGAYAALCRAVGADIDVGDFREVTDRALDLLRDVDLAATFMDYTPAVLSRRDMGYLRVWHEGAMELAHKEWWASRGFLESTAKAAHWLNADDLPVLASLGAQVAERSRHAAKGLYRALPSLLASMRVPQLVEWVDLGLRVARNEEDLVLYMSYGSKRSQEAVEVLCRETSFAAFRPRVGLLLEAFLGRPASLHSMFDLLDPASVPPDVPAFSDGQKLYIRPSLGCAGASPLSLYKLVALHAMSHQRFGSYTSDGLGRFLVRGRTIAAEEAAPTALDRFVAGVAEDFRIDAVLLRTLPGLRRDAELIVRETYGGLDVNSGRSGVPLTTASLRAHLVAFPFGVCVLADPDLAAAVESAVAPLAFPEAGPADATRVAAALGRLLQAEGAGDWARENVAGAEVVEVPYPPYHDHLYLGLKLASMTSSGTDAGAGPAPGTPVDVPDSLHPSEIIEGLEISLRDHRQEAELLVLEDDEEDGEEGDAAWDTFTYDEWNYELADYRTRWCTVRCRQLPPGDPAFVGETVERFRGEVLLIRRQFERLRPDRMRRFFRQQDGDELDLDALTEAIVDRQAGAPMSDKIFIRRDKKQRDVAVLFLLDMSDSTDQPVEGSRRVIDVEKEGLVLLSEAIGQLDDRFAIMGFSSHGRRMVDLYTIKDFDEAFGEAVAGRIGGIQPLEYTRLGAALRHATDHLRRETSGAKLLVLLSDGRPYDMAYGDMRYALEDTKMALAEARRQGVSAFCITVDPKGQDYLEDLFGTNRYTVIQNVGHLPTKLPRIYRNLTV